MARQIKIKQSESNRVAQGLQEWATKDNKRFVFCLVGDKDDTNGLVVGDVKNVLLSLSIAMQEKKIKDIIKLALKGNELLDGKGGVES